jgi:AraC-like DNA-binding protein
MEERELPCPGPCDLFFSLSGFFSLQCPEGGTVQLAPGDLVVFTSALPAANDQRRARLCATQRVELWRATVTRAPAALRTQATHTLRAAQIATEPRLCGALSLLRLELSEPDGSPVAVAHLSELIARYALEPRGRHGCPRTSSPALRRALELLHAEPARRWTLQRLAKACGASRAALARHFSRDVGIPPLRYLAELRLLRAAEFLLESDLSLAEVAAAVGYDSEFAFNRAFKRRHGLPPGMFRRRQQSSPARLGVQLAHAA